MTPRTAARVAPSRQQGRRSMEWDERAAFGAMIASIQAALQKGHLMSVAELQVGVASA